MFRNDAPLLFRPQWDWRQWRWGLQFFIQCNDAAFKRNVQQLVALGAYSHEALKDIVHTSGIKYHRLERGMAHYFTDQKSLDSAAHAASLMQGFGVKRTVISRSELLEIKPALRSFADRIVGATFTATDESGDAHIFTWELARKCEVLGVQFLYGHDLSLKTPLAKARCQMLSNRVEQVLPGVCDTRSVDQGGHPNFWAGLRPAWVAKSTFNLILRHSARVSA